MTSELDSVPSAGSTLNPGLMRLAPGSVFVWVWLPETVDPVVAGRLDDRGGTVAFTYGRSYLDNPEAIPLYLPDLPLIRGEQTPRSGNVPGCIADAAPDGWGRRVIEYRHRVDEGGLSELGYLLNSGSDRVGALDFQASASKFAARGAQQATLEELQDAARCVEQGQPLPPALDQALMQGTSIGGARPKVALADGRRRLIAKFSSVNDSYPVVKAEYAAMELARRVGLDVASVELTRAAGHDVLLVDRFDRTYSGCRKMMVSALTILNLHDALGIAGRYATYIDLADAVRARFSAPEATLQELFCRIVFNILVGNTDDHPKNHSAFWDGRMLTLTPAYDICPQPRAGGEAFQAMAYGPNGDRICRTARCVQHADSYFLTRSEAAEIVERQVEVIHRDWNEVCDRARLTTAEREQLWQRQFLNPSVFDQ